jgi:hypothetical protein
MPPQILLEVTHPEMPPGKIQGFRFLWAFYVNGYQPTLHCQPCFRGRRVDAFCTPTAESFRPVVLDRAHRYPYVYICGVGIGPRRELRSKNLHFPLKLAEGHVAEATTYNGYRFRAENAIALPIPPLSDLGRESRTNMSDARTSSSRSHTSDIRPSLSEEATRRLRLGYSEVPRDGHSQQTTLAELLNKAISLALSASQSAG